MGATPSDDTEARQRRRGVAIAGHSGDVSVALAALDDPDPAVRSTALGALERLDALDDSAVATALTDDDVAVRRRAAEVAATHPEVDLVPALRDVDARVIEVAAWACGEHESDRDEIVERLIELATDHDEPLVRESAVAALGAIGDPRGFDAIVSGATDKPAVRRRAVLALAPFIDDDELGEPTESAIARALEDRDWQVRQAAEDLRRITDT
ncbi:HEAT repeat domain-containing protein [Ilumatobacter nonamiensis]|uniref:HEAT repeat domain-containing protein n=1 Tax=Ilumatobacter nonamiensis TaxID=467093 RepID=UPI000348B551|nr:HEAT repeat domain-containing protein [Ilumatobacter nonamiensis]